MLANLVNFIEKLQGRPRNERVRILWLFTCMSAIVIFSFWFLSFKHSANETEEQNPDSNNIVQEIRDSLTAAKQEWPTLRGNLNANTINLFEQSGADGESPFD